MYIDEIIEKLDDETKNSLKTELSLYKKGVIDESMMKKVLENHNEKKKEIEEAAKQASIKRKMKDLVILLNRHPDILSNIKAIMDYRKLRVEQRAYDLMLQESKSGKYGDGQANIDRMQERVISLDKARRPTHNRALSNFCGLMREFTNAGMVPIYTGDIMDPSYEKDNYGDHRIREKMTDAMFSMLTNIEDFSINEFKLDSQDYKEGLGTFKDIYSELNQQTHDWGGRLEKDDGDLVK